MMNDNRLKYDHEDDKQISLCKKNTHKTALTKNKSSHTVPNMAPVYPGKSNTVPVYPEKCSPFCRSQPKERC